MHARSSRSAARSLLTLLVLLSAGRVTGQVRIDAEPRSLPEPPAPTVTVFEDGTPGLSADERTAVVERLQRLEERADFARKDAARLLLEERRDAADAADGRAIRVFDDLKRNPDAYRGRPVVLWGRVRSIEPESFEDESATPLSRVLISEGNVGANPVAVLVPTPEELAVTDAVVLVGDFLKLLPADEGDETAESQPLLLAGGVVRLGDRLPRTLRDTIEHRTAPRGEERDAYMTAIVQTRLADPGELRKTARTFRDARIEKRKFRHDIDEFPTYVDIFQNPDVYHGRPVTLSGHAWSVQRVPGAPAGEENAYGIDHLYSISLYTADSQTNAALVVCSELPEDMPRTGVLDDALDNVAVTGLFFKMVKYRDQSGTLRVMPMIVADTVTWSPPDGEPITPRVPVTAYPVIAAVVALLIGIACWIGFRDRQWRRKTHQRLEGDAPRFDDIDG